MCARVQQLLVIGLALLGATAGYAFTSRDRSALALITVVVVLGSFAIWLALQFALLALFGRNDDRVCERASLRQILRAWVREVRCTPMVFFWRQPFRSRAVPDRLIPSGKYLGLVLVHGYFCNRGFWNPWLRALGKIGVPFIAPNLEPVFGSIEAYAIEIEAAVRQMEEVTGHPVLIVAHSMGGLAVRHWRIQNDPLRQRVPHVITIGTPHHGTWMARFGHTRNGIEMRPGSAFLMALEHREQPEDRTSFTCFYSNCDNIVFPSSRARLAGAHNVHLTGTPHLDMLMDDRVFAEVLRRASAPAGQPSDRVKAAAPL